MKKAYSLIKNERGAVSVLAVILMVISTRSITHVNPQSSISTGQ